MAKKLIFIIPTDGKTLEQMENGIRLLWPKIKKIAEKQRAGQN
jgi:hypothetical protein